MPRHRSPGAAPTCASRLRARPGRASALGLLLLPLLAGLACSLRPAPPNVLLVTIDTLRADHCSAYGYGRPTTPRLARLAAEGLLFETAYAPIPVTGPSHASLMTGLYPRASGVVRNGYVLDAAHLTLATRLRARGYTTAAVVSAFPLDRRFGLAAGFDHYDDRFAPAESSLPKPQWDGLPLGQPYDRRADATTDRALRWLGTRPSGRPFFLWVHYFDPHSPYDPPAAYRFQPGDAAAGSAGELVAAYDGEIRFTDTQLGRLLDALDAEGLAKNTLVVVTSDHGEGLGQHGVMEHGSVVYEEAVRVPLVLRWTGHVLGGRRLAAPVELLDVAPSVLELAGAAPPASDHGVSLAPLATGASRVQDARRAVFLQREFQERAGSNTFAVRAGAHKYVETREESRVLRRELYDLAGDPQELRSLDAEQQERTEQLVRLLQAWRTRVAPGRRQQVAPENLEGLRALGYVQ
jgi:choline-sulfatase